MNSFSIVKLSSSKASKKLFLKLKEITNSVNESDLERIANETGVSLKNVEQMKSRILGREISINSNSFDDHGGQSETLDSKLKSDLPSPEDIIMAHDEKRKYLGAIAYSCLNHLDEQEKDIIANRILAEKQMTLKELANKYNISQERIRQKQEIALKKIRSHLEEKKLIESPKKSNLLS
jgi:RNA polymerase sigma-32 factor